MQAEPKSLEKVVLLPALKRDTIGTTFGKTSRAIDITKYSLDQHVAMGLIR